MALECIRVTIHHSDGRTVRRDFNPNEIYQASAYERSIAVKVQETWASGDPGPVAVYSSAVLS